jgi:hypothetical protein
MGDEVADLRQQVRDQQAVINKLEAIAQRQEAAARRQEQRLARVEALVPASGRGQDRHLTAAPVADGPVPDQDEGGQTGLDGTTDRRHLLGKAAAATAGAVVGGTALALGQASPAAAGPSTWDGNPAVTGIANPTSGTGVRGETSNGYGVYGQAVNGYGVLGFSTGGYGVVGQSSTGTAVRAIVDPAGTQLGLYGAPDPPPTSTISRAAGAIVKDVNNDLWLCVVPGTPGTWRRVSGANTAGALTLLASPVRVYDSRPPYPPTTGPKTPLVPNGPRTIDLTGNASGVPVGATAALVSLVAEGPVAAGNMAIYKDGITYPNTSNINFGAGQTVAVTTLTALSTTAKCAVRANVACNVIIDVLGYYR